MNDQVNDFKEKFFPYPNNLGKEYNTDPPMKRRSIFLQGFFLIATSEFILIFGFFPLNLRSLLEHFSEHVTYGS